ncbi:MAG: F0F1 ATP synthase subunit A [Candidatus Omnitrophica bacterium]|nr:F0F1 ATP synthase subunit A [Candidatus Omnitrophota bacterium]
MKKTVWISLVLGGLAGSAGLAARGGFFAVSLLAGVAWGLANLWCLTRAARCVAEGRRGFPLAGWVVTKFFLLYGLIAWFLVGLKLSAAAWLAGFTITLAAAAASALPSLRGLFRQTSKQLLLLGLFLLPKAAEASQGAPGGPSHPPEIPNLITLITLGREGAWVDFLHTWENGIFALLIALAVGLAISLGARVLALVPGRGQAAVEGLVEWLDNLVCGALGKKEGRRYLPFLGTLFIFILSMNLAGLIPGLKSPTSRFEMTGALGLCVFLFVQWTGLRRLGLIGYGDHLLGQPRDLVGWILSPLMLFIHGIGEIVKPLSLALRLFGNIMGEDTLLGVFVALGAMAFAWSRLPVGIPLHLPFIALALIFSFVQALVFTSLSMIYIYMMLPHEEAH